MVLIHLLVDAQGMPLSALSAPSNEDKRKYVGYLIESIEVKTRNAGRQRKKVSRLAAYKGYNKYLMINFLKKEGVQRQISRKRNAMKRRSLPFSMKAQRFQVERAFSWLQRKFRWLVVRWERLPCCFDAFLSMSICFMWIKIIMG